MDDYEEEFRRTLDYKENDIPYTYVDGRITPDVDETLGGTVAPIAEASEIPKVIISPPGQPDVLNKIGTPEERAAVSGVSTPGYDEMFKEVLAGVSTELVNTAAGLATQTKEIAMAIGPAATNKMLQEVVRFGAEMVDAAGKKIGSDPQALNLVRDIIPQIKVEGAVANISKDLAAAAWTFVILKNVGAGTISAAAATDAFQNIEEGNLSTVAEEFGFFPELAKYFNSKVGRDASAEKRLEGRMKAVFEGMGLASAFRLIFTGVKNIKKAGPAVAPLFIGPSSKNGDANPGASTPDNVGAK